MHSITRSGLCFSYNDVENDDNEFVELDKSNVLLMGPTGSGMTNMFLAHMIILLHVVYIVLLMVQLSCCCLRGLLSDSYYFTFTIRIGKTLLAKTLARIVNVPFVIADATSLTQASSFLCMLLYPHVLYNFKVILEAAYSHVISKGLLFMLPHSSLVYVCLFCRTYFPFPFSIFHCK